MVIRYQKTFSHKNTFVGGGIVDKIINALPVELHLPGYQYCGPGTKLQKRLNRGDKGINLLDSACKNYDIAYSKNKDLSTRHKADKILENSAWNRVLSKDSSLAEKSFAYMVTNAMKAKTKFGMGVEKKKNVGKNKLNDKKLFRTSIRAATKILNKEKPLDINSAIKIARKTINKSLKGKKSQIIVARVIRVPKIGGFLPLIPILTALGAIGSLTAGGAAIAKAVNATKNAKNQLDEATRHNRAMESIAVGKGLYLKPYKKGLNHNLFSQKRIKKLLEMLPNGPLSDVDLNRFSINIPYFRGVFMLNSLPKRAKKIECGIINLDVSTGPGTHCVA